MFEELAVGAAAGACAKAFTTPVSNVVTRRQTASLLVNKNNGTPSINSSKGLTFREIVADIRRERGVLGLWAGYSASLVLTLNPSTTFFLQQILKRALVPRENWDEPGARVTFFLAAMSKVAATTLTYPFQIAKARVQVSAKPSPKAEEKGGDGGSGKQGGSHKRVGSGVRGIARETIFATVFRIARTEGVKALYDGIGGELLKAFFNHGTTMLSKDIIHKFLVQFYLAIVAFLQKHPDLRARIAQKMRDARTDVRNAYDRTSSLGLSEARRLGARCVQIAVGSGERAKASILGSSQN